VSANRGAPAGAVERVGPHGAPLRHFRVGLSAEALALAWARTEDAPALATVVVDHEVTPRGLAGRLWSVAPEDTLALAVVLRPTLPADDADSVWLAGGSAAAAGAAAAGAAGPLATWWPDTVVDPSTGDEVAMVKAETQLGPGQVRSAIVTLRLDLRRLGLAGRSDDLLAAVLGALRIQAGELDDDAGGAAALYTTRCALVGQRVRASLLPKGEARGVVQTIDRHARLQLESSTGMVEHVGIDQLRELMVVP
jgi:biotin-(acetyl-CoA carboxylase) ligase